MPFWLHVPDVDIPSGTFSKGLRLSGTLGFGRGKQNIDFSRGLMYCLIYLSLLIGISSITYYATQQPCRKYINHKWG
jgi:hypothetical protein